MPPVRTQRLAYLDWLRGLACLGMFEVHSYDSWLGGATRQSLFFRWSQLTGTIPAPLFIFLSGVTCAFVADNMRRKGFASRAIGRRLIRRGGEVFGLGLLFRAQEFALGWPIAPWTDLFRVDVLNLIGLSIVFIGLVSLAAQNRTAMAFASAGVALAVALVTPMIWSTWRPRWLPWYLESYFNGVHIFNSPQPWLFPIFPWAAFAFAGVAVGIVLFSEWSSRNPGWTMALLGGGGVGLFCLSQWLDAQPLQLCTTYDYWHTSPNFFLARVGLLLVIVLAGYAWCRWGLGGVGFSPLSQMGQTSLLVYWVHIEFIYGRLSIFEKQAQGIGTATLGFFTITTAMVLLSLARTRTKGRGSEILAWLTRFRPANVGRSQETSAEG